MPKKVKEVTKFIFSKMVWKNQPKKVIVLYAKRMNLLLEFLSTIQHVKLGWNLRKPLRKAKYN